LFLVGCEHFVKFFIASQRVIKLHAMLSPFFVYEDAHTHTNILLTNKRFPSKRSSKNNDTAIKTIIIAISTLAAFFKLFLRARKLSLKHSACKVCCSREKNKKSSLLVSEKLLLINSFIERETMQQFYFN
jgi:hypothetical protein